jgi:hypothetical protein
MNGQRVRRPLGLRVSETPQAEAEQALDRLLAGPESRQPPSSAARLGEVLGAYLKGMRARRCRDSAIKGAESCRRGLVRVLGAQAPIDPPRSGGLRPLPARGGRGLDPHDEQGAADPQGRDAGGEVPDRRRHGQGRPPAAASPDPAAAGDPDRARGRAAPRRDPARVDRDAERTCAGATSTSTAARSRCGPRSHQPQIARTASIEAPASSISDAAAVARSVWQGFVFPSCQSPAARQIGRSARPRSLFG